MNWLTELGRTVTRRRKRSLKDQVNETNNALTKYEDTISLIENRHGERTPEDTQFIENHRETQNNLNRLFQSIVASDAKGQYINPTDLQIYIKKYAIPSRKGRVSSAKDKNLVEQVRRGFRDAMAKTLLLLEREARKKHQELSAHFHENYKFIARYGYKEKGIVIPSGTIVQVRDTEDKEMKELVFSRYGSTTMFKVPESDLKAIADDARREKKQSLTVAIRQAPATTRRRRWGPSVEQKRLQECPSEYTLNDVQTMETSNLNTELVCTSEIHFTQDIISPIYIRADKYRDGNLQPHDCVPLEIPSYMKENRTLEVYKVSSNGNVYAALFSLVPIKKTEGVDTYSYKDYVIAKRANDDLKFFHQAVGKNRDIKEENQSSAVATLQAPARTRRRLWGKQKRLQVKKKPPNRIRCLKVLRDDNLLISDNTNTLIKSLNRRDEVREIKQFSARSVSYVTTDNPNTKEIILGGLWINGYTDPSETEAGASGPADPKTMPKKRKEPSKEELVPEVSHGFTILDASSGQKYRDITYAKAMGMNLLRHNCITAVLIEKTYYIVLSNGKTIQGIMFSESTSNIRYVSPQVSAPYHHSSIALNCSKTKPDKIMISLGLNDGKVMVNGLQWSLETNGIDLHSNPSIIGDARECKSNVAGFVIANKKDSLYAIQQNKQSEVSVTVRKPMLAQVRGAIGENLKGTNLKRIRSMKNRSEKKTKLSTKLRQARRVKIIMNAFIAGNATEAFGDRLLEMENQINGLWPVNHWCLMALSRHSKSDPYEMVYIYPFEQQGTYMKMRYANADRKIIMNVDSTFMAHSGNTITIEGFKLPTKKPPSGDEVKKYTEIKRVHGRGGSDPSSSVRGRRGDRTITNGPSTPQNPRSRATFSATYSAAGPEPRRNVPRSEPAIRDHGNRTRRFITLSAPARRSRARMRTNQIVADEIVNDLKSPTDRLRAIDDLYYFMQAHPDYRIREKLSNLDSPIRDEIKMRLQEIIKQEEARDPEQEGATIGTGGDDVSFREQPKTTPRSAGAQTTRSAHPIIDTTRVHLDRRAAKDVNAPMYTSDSAELVDDEF